MTNNLKLRKNDLKDGSDMKVLVVMLMVRVSALVHVLKNFVGKLDSILPFATVSYLQVALRAKYDTIAEGVRAAMTFGFPVMRLPTPVCTSGAVSFAELFTTIGTMPTLPPPRILYSVARKGHRNTSRVEVANPRVKNGWIRNEDMWVLVRDGKSYNVAITYTPPWEGRKGGYVILKGHRAIGTSRTLEAAKRRAEKIKIPRVPFK
jgi:hypothetical protein